MTQELQSFTSFIEEGFVVRYNNPKSDKHGSERQFSDKEAADKHAARGNSVDKSGGKYTVHKTNEKGHDVKEELKGDQHKLDKNKNGKLDAHDFKLLRKEESELDEALDPSEIASNPRMYSADDAKKAYYHKKASDSDKETLAKHLDRHHGNKNWRKPVKEEAEQVDEAMSPQQKSDFDRMMAGAMSRAAYNAKWKKPLKSDSKVIYGKNVKEEAEIVEETDDEHYSKQSQKMKDAINLHLRKGKSYSQAVTDAKVHVKEEIEQLDEVGDTKKGQKLLQLVNKRAVNRLTSKRADTDPEYAKKAQQTHLAADERLKEEVELEESMADSWKKVQSMDKGSVTGGKDEVRKRLAYLSAVHAHHKKYGNDTKKVKADIESINRSKIAEEVEELDEAVKTGNEGNGYHGQHPSEKADAAYSKAHAMVKKVAGEAGHLRDAKKPNVMVKHYLDSRHGRHLAGNEHDHEYIKKDFGKFKKSYKPEHFSEEMSDEQKAKREKIVKGMKKSYSDFVDRYGSRAKEVMYATATKRAMGEEADCEYEDDKEEMKESNAFDWKSGGHKTSGKYDIKQVGNRTIVTRKYNPETGHSTGTDDDDKPAEKRGRGRPAGSKSGAKQKGSGKSNDYRGIPQHSLNLPK